MLSRSAALALSTLALPASSLAIIGGTADAADSVYQYMGTMSNGFSGSPISPNWFVTATHIAPGVGSTYTNPDGTFTVANVVKVPSGFVDANGQSIATDITLVQVGGTFAHYYGYGAAAVGTDPNANGTGGTNGTRVTFAGIGDRSPGVGTAPVGNPGHTRYVASNTVDTLTGVDFRPQYNEIFTAYAYDLDDFSSAHNVVGSQNGLRDATGAPTEGGVANGDSGGGWFVGSGGALPTLIAVSSGVGPQFDGGNAYDAGGVGVGADLDAYSGFISQTVGVAPVPEPAPLAALALGALAMVRRRKGLRI